MGIFGDFCNPSSPYANTPSTTEKDGHGRTIRLEQIDVDPDGSNPVTVTNDYYYNPLGNLEEIVQDSGRKAVSKTQVFDSIGQKRVINDPTAGTWQLSYDDAGNLIQSIDANGNVIEYGYDLANRLIWEDCVGKMMDRFRKRQVELSCGGGLLRRSPTLPMCFWEGAQLGAGGTLMVDRGGNRGRGWCGRRAAVAEWTISSRSGGKGEAILELEDRLVHGCGG